MKIWHGIVLAGIVTVGAIAACSRSEIYIEPEPVRDETSLRTTALGELVGFTHHENDVHVWRGIPFAAAPVGDLRWRAPRPAEAWDGVREALDHAPWCVQIKGPLDDSDPTLSDVPVGTAVGQEDCLYLNLYAPKMSVDEAASANLPVMMWIHGGSNVWGRAQQYDPSDFVENENVIVAVMQYRLGPLGWFAHQTIRDAAETEADRSANFAILDQIAALDWLAENASVFGGNPDNVTIFGESAGGHDVATLLGSPMASGKFHRAIVQSGSFRSESLEDAETATNQASGPIVTELFPDSSAVTADDLRAVSVDDFFGAYLTDADDGLEPPRIIEDGIVVPTGGLRQAFASTDTFNAVPIMSGTNKDEMKFFNVFVDELVNWRFGALPKARNQDVYDAVSDAQSRMWRYGAVDQPFALMSDAGHDALYGYRFDWDDEGSVWGSDFADLFGAAHSFEIPFVFGQFRFLGSADKWVFTKKNEADRLRLSREMQAYWAQFARTGDPDRGTGGDQPDWSAWSTESRVENLMVLDTQGDGTVRMVADQETGERIRADLFADPRLPDLTYKCRLHKATEYWDPAFEPTADGRCPSSAVTVGTAE